MRILRITILFFFSVAVLPPTVSAQSVKTYDKEWKNVENYMSKKLPASALQEVKKIYALAKKDNQDAQLIKAALYMTSLQQETREENEVAGITSMEKEAAVAKPVPAAIMRSLLAGMYWQYYQQNRWKLYSRTATINYNKTDITTWSPEDFFK
jgi:CRISPR/Cas system endoribonuclease Cas6 (RAMP superfamily)